MPLRKEIDKKYQGVIKIKGMINQVICGDCLEVMKDLHDKSIDMILCDLPI